MLIRLTKDCPALQVKDLIAAYIHPSLEAVTNDHVFSGLEDSLAHTPLLLQVSG